MIAFLRLAALPVALLLAPAAWAQTATAPAPAAPVASVVAKPALWVVKDKDTTIYLFGSIHVLKPEISWFNGAVKSSFEKSDQLVLEMITPDPATLQGLVMKMALNPGGPAVAEQLPADKRDAYAKAMAGAGIPQAAFDMFKPWLAGVTLSVAGLPKLGYDPESGVEKVLTKAAEAAKKPVVGLETAEQQLGYFGTMPDKMQIEFLVSAIDDYPKLGDELGKMIASWTKGDPDTLAAQMNESMKDSPDIAKLLLTDRNARWAKWIEQRLEQPGTVFIAVGAGHLAGSDSVQTFLAKDHVKAERIAY